MTTKEIILAGGKVEFSYKQNLKEWVGTARIFGFSGGFGLKPYILVEIPTSELAPGGRKEFEYKDIDKAISVFESLVFRPENLMYKMHESMIQLYESGETDLDLDDNDDLKKVQKLQKKLQKVKKIKVKSTQKNNNDYVHEECGNCSCDFIRHKDDKIHKESGTYLCGQCKTQW